MQQKYPEKLIIEPTTRCNFKCEMCVKQSKGCEIVEGDLNVSIFENCKDLFEHASSVVFTGIGEPLLNTSLETFLSNARDKMQKNSIRGFQTNGKLLTFQRADALIKAGMNKICISVDSMQPHLFDAVRQGGMLSDINQAFDNLERARKQDNKNKIEIGIEFVLMKKNMAELPLLVDWAHQRNVDFIIVSHISAYEKTAEKEIAYLNNSFKSLELFEKYKKSALKKGLDIQIYEDIRFKVKKTSIEEEIYHLVDEFKQEAIEQSLYVNMFHLSNEPQGEFERIQGLFDQALDRANQAGIELILPQIRPRTDRYCPFVEENTMFITWDGNVSPCYFLWHKYTVLRVGYIKHINPVYFGNVQQKAAEQIWQTEEFTSFRKKVLQYDYPNCHAWCETRCDYVLDEPFYQDCYINDIPCCDCQWGLGLFNCLT